MHKNKKKKFDRKELKLQKEGSGGGRSFVYPDEDLD